MTKKLFTATAMILAVVIRAGADAELESGQWRMSSDGTLYSIDANRADVKDILRALQEVSPSEFRIRDFRDREVSLRLYNVTLGTLLDRLDLSFTLQYEKFSGDDEYTLSKGWVSFFDPQPAQPNPFAGPGLAAGGGITTPSAGTGAGVFPEKARALLAEVKEREEYNAAFPVTVKLDGTKSDWPESIPRQFISHQAIVTAHAPTNDTDASFGVAGVADDDYLYLALDVADDLKATNRASALPLMTDDNLQIVVGTGKAGEKPVTVTINRHHVLAAQAAGSDGIQAAAKQYVSFHGGTKAAIIDSPNGWAVEVAVPFSLLGVKGKDASTLGFNVLMNDADLGEKDFATLSWSRYTKLTAFSPSATSSSLGTLRVLDVR